jgi:hypothetical protein
MNDGAQTIRIPHSAFRNLALTFALTLLALWAVGAWRGAMGYEMLIVAMGWPHVLLGFVFFLGKVLRGEAGARRRFVVLSAATLVWWGAHYAWGVAALVYVYFLYHAFRDEVFVYLTTRAAHRPPAANVYRVAGVVPLLLLLLLISKPQDYRQDLRRAETTTAQTNADGWTLFQFRPVAEARGHEFYFYLQAPHTAGLNGLNAVALRGAGAARVNDELWPDAVSLIFAPQYDGESAPPVNNAANAAVGLLGGHRVGQTFTAERDNLSGVWLRTARAADTPDAPLAFHLASPPLLPLSPLWARLRWALIALMSAVLLWRVVPQLRANRELWLYLAVFGLALAGLQNWLKIVVNEGRAVPMIFQFVVVFHYFSWYVFTFDKMSALRDLPAPPVKNAFDAWLANLRVPGRFALAVVAMSLISAGGVIWYYLGAGPNALRFGFDYSYFLYFLVFHVTFSFQPKV